MASSTISLSQDQARSRISKLQQAVDDLSNYLSTGSQTLQNLLLSTNYDAISDGEGSQVDYLSDFRSTGLSIWNGVSTDLNGIISYVNEVISRIKTMAGIFDNADDAAKTAATTQQSSL
ncbi:MAG: hypothetical protein LBM66_07860 [Bifidobacteriaceae bacterium]|jgi:hypothetical protein|nr:hypothetical protein [Bifidobacteriaceae bacterium]